MFCVCFERSAQLLSGGTVQVSLMNVDSTTITGATPPTPIALTSVTLSGVAMVQGLLTVWVPYTMPLGMYNICGSWVMQAHSVGFDIY